MMLSRAAALLCATTAALAASGGVLAFAPHPPAVARIAKSGDGHFWVQAQARAEALTQTPARFGGRPLRMLVDTGSSAVALTPADARALGLDPERLAYDRRVLTAAGPAPAAPVRLAALAVGGTELHSVDALVVRRGLPASLLGMSWLGRLSRLEATPDALILAR